MPSSESSSGSAEHAATDREPARKGGLAAYLPLIVVVGVAALAACALQRAPLASGNLGGWMHDFMGVFLALFAMFKLFDLSGFADGFQMYDLLARRIRFYALLYPGIELLLGLGYLARHPLPELYAATIAVLGFGALGVILALRRGLDVDCACMGSILKVPLSTVAMVENLSMATMAAVMWLRYA